MSITALNTNPDLSLKHYTRLLIAFACVLLILSLYQYIVLYNRGIISSVFSISFLLSITHHIGFAAFVGLLLVAPYYYLEKSKYSRGYRFTFFILIILLALECFLVLYFTRAYIPLGANVLNYGFLDFKTAINSNVVVPFLFLLMFIIIVLLFYGLYLITSKYYHYVNKMFPFTFFLLTVFVASMFMSGQPINQNKTQYLAVNLFENFMEDDSYFDNKNNPPYPLLKTAKNDYSLGGNFNLSTKKPNIVIVMVNGLGKDFVGKESVYNGFTPFLDSLAQKSLYWKNCFSTTAKSFGALPAIIGSLPYGKQGFMSIPKPINRLTLFGILKNNGYATAYLQGTNSSFNNVDNFLQQEQVDLVIDRSYFGAKYMLSPKDKAGESIGYPDKELFKKSFNTPRNNNKPKLEVYLTTSLKEPFLIPNKSNFIDKVTNILARSKASEHIKKQQNNNKDVMASILYTDTSLKYFIESYKNKEEFKNTIFIITGTHRLLELPVNNELSKYNVPLLIYSPMLKAPKKIESITSHLDITPSLTGLMVNKYKISVPKKVAWLGETLPLHTTFKANRSVPLMRAKNQIEEYLYQNYFYSSGTTFKVDDNLNLTQSENDSVYAALKRFRSINAYVTKYDKLLPQNLAVFNIKNIVFTEEDKIWINSVLNGQSFDSAYKTAQKMAFNGKTEDALRLCNYIIQEIPSHIDAKILKGRIKSWSKNYDEAEKILLKCIATNPTYADSYNALLDVYFWSNQNNKIKEIESIIIKNDVKDKSLSLKIERAHTELTK
ncbi:MULTISPECIES: sulfatase-like hydrolase/transferase [unclassified Cellulophaga]|uniref:sulfatase-like hydrolase/transferase n=1 Tax=unclassified Cellulophaga TaxID=2634405 RepID=UPI0026E37A8C|nr:MULTISPECIES: sulfatase-like hydrolase/transferase [unclassified Cellulophaga]MDO6492579.1 sulfatase-like hydrolase/transferase [Cellulophaga sp. 2_MG-2023]MDO6493681.1 sulfatase-like hydrolase/transferase [Cellulophaga sp. 3_MG-2023]